MGGVEEERQLRRWEEEMQSNGTHEAGLQAGQQDSHPRRRVVGAPMQSPLQLLHQPATSTHLLPPPPTWLTTRSEDWLTSEPRRGASASISSKKSTQGAAARARENSWRTARSLSPTYLQGGGGGGARNWLRGGRGPHRSGGQSSRDGCC